MKNKAELADQDVVIVGLGLMGGSLAKALAGRVKNISAVDTNEQFLAEAMADGVIDNSGTDLLHVANDGAFIILATPVSVILDQLKNIAAFYERKWTILDLGSTKRFICSAMDNLPESIEAVGGHPMCGRDTSGYPMSDRNLYQGETFILCPTARTSEQTMTLALALVEVIGARPLVLEPVFHDDLVATTSHLPYLVSALLMDVAGTEALDSPKIWQVSASGLRDTTRLAGSDPMMMHGILMTNRDFVLERLDNFREKMERLRHYLATGDQVQLVTWLEEIKTAHAAYQRIRW